jgi:hypothetical protein
MKNNCHPLSNSFFPASKITLSSNFETKVSTHFLISGGFERIETSRIPLKVILRLLGIGVADILKMSIFHFISFIFSLSFTQNLCSSSITKSPKSLY